MIAAKIYLYVTAFIVFIQIASAIHVVIVERRRRRLNQTDDVADAKAVFVKTGPDAGDWKKLKL